jgi:hypothetical protein
MNPKSAINKRITYNCWILKMAVWQIEGLFLLYMPIHLYGWKLGLLIYSGLSSLLHIAGLLSGMFPVFTVLKRNPD